VRLIFTDGHDTGLYSWEYLHQLGVNQERLWQDYLARLEQAGASRSGETPSPAPAAPKRWKQL
jgi:DUF971 family protein